MSIYDDDELNNLDAIRFETQIGTSKIRFTTPKLPGCKATLDLGEGRPRNWAERKGPGISGATLVAEGPGLVSGTITIEYTATTAAEREAMRFDRDAFALMVGSPIPGNPEKVFTINHPMAAALEPPMVACVFLNDAPLKHNDVTGQDVEVWKIKEYRKQAPTLTSTTAPGGSTAEGQAKDELATLVSNRATELESLATQAGITGGAT